MSRLSFITVMLLFMTAGLWGQHHVVSGTVRFCENGEPAEGATVVEKGSTKGVLTDINGKFRIETDRDEISLEFSYVGCEGIDTTIRIGGDVTLDICLKYDPEQLVDVIVVGESPYKIVSSTKTSTVSVPMEIVNCMPTLAGERDIVKAIQLMPGVQSGTEGTAGLYVRGGGPDENLVLLDGVPMYNMNHAMGLFSVFNSDMVSKAELHKGDIPTKYGGRLSSVLDVSMLEGDMREYHGTVAVGLLAAKANVGGPIWKDHTTFNLSFRRTYFDIFAQPLIAAISSREGTLASAGYYFYDINAKIDHTFSDRDKLGVTFYMGDDGIYMSEKEKASGMKLGTDWRWGNIVASIDWKHNFTDLFKSKMSVAYTHYKYNLGLSEEAKEEEFNNTFDMKFNSLISDVMFRYDFDYKSNNLKHDVNFGAEYTYHFFKPSVMSAVEIEAGIPLYEMDTTFGNTPIHNHEAAIYAEENWNIHKYFKLKAGLRGALYNSHGKNYFSLEPRAGINVTIVPTNLSFKASYSYTTQYVHLLTSSNVTLPTDLWVPVTENVPPMKCHQVAGGFYAFLPWGDIEMSVEGYYKKMANVIEYKDGASYISTNGDWEDKVVVGDGWSYGVEVLIQRNIGKLTGWIGYTWSRTLRRFDREGMVLNGGKVFPAKYDREHDLSICLQYKPIKLLDVSATFIYGTGTCGTLPLQTAPDGTTIVTERNNFRMPDYHRLDLAMNFHWDRKMKKDGSQRRYGEHQLNISCYNVYNRKNPFIVYAEGEKLMQLSVFQILPSLGYTFKF